MTSTAVVYVVDDEQPIRQAFEVLLRGRGITIRSFDSAEALLHAYSSCWRGCLFADVKMPEMGGSDLYSELKRRNSELTVILMTGHGTADSLRQLHGHDLISLEKPFSADSLMRVLKCCGILPSSTPD